MHDDSDSRLYTHDVLPRAELDALDDPELDEALPWRGAAWLSERSRTGFSAPARLSQSRRRLPLGQMTS